MLLYLQEELSKYLRSWPAKRKAATKPDKVKKVSTANSPAIMA